VIISGLTFLSYLNSRVVAVHLKGDVHCFVHSSLLCRASERFAAALKGPFIESENLEIRLPEECPELFAYFAAYLYRLCVPEDASRNTMTSKWSQQISILIFARLYAMAERFMADSFKSSIQTQLRLRLARPQELTVEDVCGLLRVSCEEIVGRTPTRQDYLRQATFSIAATRLNGPRRSDSLHASETFRNLLLVHPELGQELCLQMCDS
jgi:hypothetical protein